MRKPIKAETNDQTNKKINKIKPGFGRRETTVGHEKWDPEQLLPR